MTRLVAKASGALVLVALIVAPRVAIADLRLHVDGAGAVPLDRVLFDDAGPGVSLGGAIDYEIVDLLAIGLFYSFTNFVDSIAEADEDQPQSINDHAIGARLDLRFVRHRTAGWFGNDSGNAYGEAFISLDLTFHYLGLQPRIGWGLGLGYRVVAAGPFGFGPFFRFRHVVAGFSDETDSTGHQMYVTFGLEFFLTFDVAGEREEENDDQGESSGDDEWSEFEAVSEGG